MALTPQQAKKLLDVLQYMERGTPDYNTWRDSGMSLKDIKGKPLSGEMVFFHEKDIESLQAQGVPLSALVSSGLVYVVSSDFADSYRQGGYTQVGEASWPNPADPKQIDSTAAFALRPDQTAAVYYEDAAGNLDLLLDAQAVRKIAEKFRAGGLGQAA